MTLQGSSLRYIEKLINTNDGFRLTIEKEKQKILQRVKGYRFVNINRRWAYFFNKPICKNYPGAICQNFLWTSLSSTITETTIHLSDCWIEDLDILPPKFRSQSSDIIDSKGRNSFSEPLILWIFCMLSNDLPFVNLEGLILTGIWRLEY